MKPMNTSEHVKRMYYLILTSAVKSIYIYIYIHTHTHIYLSINKLLC